MIFNASSITDVPCGIIPHRIVGGSEATPHSIPWQVGLVLLGGSSPFCGGTLIGSRHVLSAAHCSQAVSNFDILVGEHDLTDGSDGTIYPVQSYSEHPNYNSDSEPTYDFVVITLAHKVVLGDVAIHACLPTETLDDNYLSGKTLTVSGWGRLETDGHLPSVLHTVDVPFVPNTECNEAYSGRITEVMLCAGNVVEGGVDSCQGDSGGNVYS